MRYAREDMATAEESRAQGHEIGDSVVAIANQFVQDACDEGESFGMIKSYAACEASLGELADLRYQELIYLRLKSLSASV